MPVSRVTTEQLAAETAAVFGRAETRLLSLMAKYMAAGTESPQWVTDKLAELGVFRRQAERIVRQARAEGATAVFDALTQAYTAGTAAGQGDLDVADVELDAPPAHAQRAVRALAAETLGQVDGIAGQVLRSTVDGYRDVVARAAAGTLTGATTRVQDAQHALDGLARRGLTGFVDARGRQWQSETYVEMALRTATARASVAGHLDRLEQGGIALVMVSDSPRECETCRPWEGKVLSRGPIPAAITSAVDGSRVRVDVAGTVNNAMRAGLMHPNCTHSLSAFIPGATRPPAQTANADGYAARQELRRLERQVREWKRRQSVAITPEAKARASAKVRQWQSAIRDHVDANSDAAGNGLQRNRRRERNGAR